MLEWGCRIKFHVQCAAEGAPFLTRHIIQPTPVALYDVAGDGNDPAMLKKILGIEA